MSPYSQGNLFVPMANLVSGPYPFAFLESLTTKMANSIPGSRTSSFNESGMLFVLTFSILHNDAM